MENINHKINIAFLFGSGAEAAYEICNGEEFAKFILGLEDNKKNEHIQKCISDHYTNILNQCRICSEHPKWYPTYYSFKKYNINTLLKNSIMKKWIDEKRDPSSITELNNDLEKEVKKCKGNEKKIKIISASPNYMGILDENFHTLIAPRLLGPDKFWRVITIITRAYIAICLDLLDIKITNITENNHQVEALLQDPYQTYIKIVKTINQNNKFKCKSYYSILNDLLKTCSMSADIITTNYTPIIEQIISNRNNVAYVHGHIKLFESPYYLQVKDITKDFEKDKFERDINFPYMFIQSGVKPIVEKYQLKAFSCMLDILDKNNYLFVVGYNFNGDDNHINSLLHSYLHEKITDTEIRKNTIVFFDFISKEQKRKDERLNELYDRLRIPIDNRNGVSKVNLKLIQINQNNCLDEFEKAFKKYCTTNEISNFYSLP